MSCIIIKKKKMLKGKEKVQRARRVRTYCPSENCCLFFFFEIVLTK